MKFLLAIFATALTFASCFQQRKIENRVTTHFDVKRQWPVVLLTLNGKPAYFLLDTGANETLLDASDSSEYDFNVKIYGRVGVGVGGYTFSNFVDSANITVSDSLLHGDYSCQDLSKIFAGYEALTDRNLVGIIGNDIMKGNSVIIDYSKLTVSFTNFVSK